MKINMDKVWDVIINKAHVAIVVTFQGAVLVWHHVTARDLGANVAQTLNWFYLFMAGHFGASQIWPDKNTPAPPVADQDKG